MIIEFPKKYSVKLSSNEIYFNVSVPEEYIQDLHALFLEQKWISSAFKHDPGDITVFASMAYEVTNEQAKQALEQLCEFVMSPPVQMDGALSDELSAILSE